MYLETYLFPFNLTIYAYLFILSSKFSHPWKEIVLWTPSYLSAFFWKKDAQNEAAHEQYLERRKSLFCRDMKSQFIQFKLAPAVL